MLLFTAVLGGCNSNLITIKAVQVSSVCRLTTPKENCKAQVLNQLQTKVFTQLGIASPEGLMPGTNASFQALVENKIGGAIKEVKIIQEDQLLQNSNYQYFIKADVSALKYSTIQKPFFFSVLGLKESYLKNEPVSFTVKSAKGAYLQIFQLQEGGEQVAMFFPSWQEYYIKFTANINYKFPLNPAVEYIAQSDKASEENTLLFLFTKERVPFKGPMTREALFNFIANIKADDRSLKIFQYTVNEK